MCSSVMCGGYGGGYQPPHDDPWYYKILDGLTWVIWFLYQPIKWIKKKVGR